MKSGPAKEQNLQTNWSAAQEFLFASLLVIATLIPYYQTSSFEFTNFDDPVYVQENLLLRDGLALPRMKQAIWGFHEANWHPLVWLSYMAEVELFGMKPEVMHVTNFVLHIANGLLLYAWLRRSTGDAVRSLFAGLIFALHPLHVESVAWITERKDVLSTLFLFGTLIAYIEYTRKKSWNWYLATFTLFAVGLTAKGMLVTVPVLLVLVDLWPLRRLPWPRSNDPEPIPLKTLLIEKIPFGCLSAIVSVITVLAQKSGGAVSDLTVLPLPERLANAIVAYSRYCLKTAFPFQLSVFYPMPVNGALAGVVLLSLLFLVAVSVAAFVNRKRRPAFLMGWLWFLVSLLPVIGLIQVGMQSIADRYMYVPMTGLSIAILWCLPDSITRPTSPWFQGLVVVLLVLTIAAHSQVSVWKNSIALFEHSITIEPVNNQVALRNLSLAYNKAGEFNKTVQFLNPDVMAQGKDAVLWVQLGNAMRDLNRVESAIDCFTTAIRIDPDLSEALNNLGLLISRTDNAVGKSYFVRAIAANPKNARAHNSLGNALVREGKLEDAQKSYLEAIRLADLSESKQNLEYVRELLGQQTTPQ